MKRSISLYFVGQFHTLSLHTNTHTHIGQYIEPISFLIGWMCVLDVTWRNFPIHLHLALIWPDRKWKNQCTHAVLIVCLIYGCECVLCVRVTCVQSFYIRRTIQNRAKTRKLIFLSLFSSLFSKFLFCSQIEKREKKTKTRWCWTMKRFMCDTSTRCWYWNVVRAKNDEQTFHFNSNAIWTKSSAKPKTFRSMKLWRKSKKSKVVNF